MQGERLKQRHLFFLITYSEHKRTPHRDPLIPHPHLCLPKTTNVEGKNFFLRPLNSKGMAGILAPRILIQNRCTKNSCSALHESIVTKAT